MEPVVGRPGGINRPVSPWAVRLAAAVGLVAAAGVTVLVGWIVPDRGPTSISLRQGLGYGMVFAAAPLGVLLARAQASSAAGLGGGMFVAGAATLPGGNLGGLIMLLSGLLLLLVGVARRPSLDATLMVRFLLSAIALVIGTYLALDTRLVTAVGVLVTAAAVTFAGLFTSHVRPQKPSE